MVAEPACRLPAGRQVFPDLSDVESSLFYHSASVATVAMVALATAAMKA